jgi:hypothetical protein
VYADICDNYYISPTVIGQGCYGVVRECIHRSTGQTLAVKSIEKSKVGRLDHLQREIFLLGKVNHHGIMKMVDCCEDAAYVHIVSVKYTGGELFYKIIDNVSPCGCLSEYKAASIMKSLLEAVAYLHENDVVPFCSFDSLRRMSHTIDDIDDATNMIVGPLMAIGKLPIGPLMRRKVFKDLDLEPAANAEKLAIPAPYAIWMQKQSENEGGDPVYDAMFCRPEAKNGDKGTNDLHVLFDDRMIADHMNPEYERALASIATQMKGVHGIDGYTFPSRCVK